MKSESETIDPRWNLVLDQSWKCASCLEEHRGIFDLGCAKPDAFSGSEEYEPNAVVVSSTHGLSEDFCILDGEHYFIRCILRLPLIGAPGQYFSYGVWSTLSKKNFVTYSETFDVGEQGSLGPWFGWFSNRLRGYPETFNLKCQVHPQNGRNRPWLELEPSDHPLTKESSEGITSIPKTFPSDQCLEPNLMALRGLALPENGAGDGNRTHTGAAFGAGEQAVSRDDESQV
jgi:hypothetical protein